MVLDHYLYWQEPPPEPSASLVKWLRRLRDGWRANRRIGGMGYDSRAEWFRMYLWEYLHVFYWLEKAAEKTEVVVWDRAFVLGAVVNNWHWESRAAAWLERHLGAIFPDMVPALEAKQ